MARVPYPPQSRLTLAAHELRTPLSVTLGYLRLLRRQASDTLPAELVRLVDESERGCGRLTTLIGEMSRLGQLEAGTLAWTPSAVDVRDVLRAAVAGVGGDHAIQPLIDDQPSIVQADPERLQEALESLARVTARRLGERPLTVVHRQTDRGTAIVFADADVVPLLLRARPPACPLDESPGGFGLALPVARCIIETSGGSVHSPHTADAVLPGALVRWPGRPASKTPFGTPPTR